MVQGGTSWYQAVPSGTKAVQGGNKLYQNGSMQYRQVHTGTFLIVVQQYFLVRTGTYCFVLIFLLNQVMLAYRIPCCNAARLNALYSKSMQAQARFNEHWDPQVLLLFCPLPPMLWGGIGGAGLSQAAAAASAAAGGGGACSSCCPSSAAPALSGLCVSAVRRVCCLGLELADQGLGHGATSDTCFLEDARRKR
jgi:hypothetical protein